MISKIDAVNLQMLVCIGNEVKTQVIVIGRYHGLVLKKMRNFLFERKVHLSLHSIVSYAVIISILSKKSNFSQLMSIRRKLPWTFHHESA